MMIRKRKDHTMEGDALIRSKLKHFLQGQKLAVLATQGAGGPYVSLMAFTVSEDLRQLIIATQKGTRKYANIQENPQVALMIDNRSEQGGGFQTTLAVTAVGRARAVEGKERTSLISRFLQRHPELADFVHTPGCVLVRVDVDRYVLVSRFEEVQELVFSEQTR